MAEPRQIDWSVAVAAHAKLAGRLYEASELSAVARLAGLVIREDGSNTATSERDINRYVAAVEATLGEIAALSARLTITNKVRELKRKA